MRSGRPVPRERRCPPTRPLPAAVRATHSDRENQLATRTLSRRALRDQNDAAEAATESEEPQADEGAGDTAAPKVKKVRARKSNDPTNKTPAKPRARKKKAQALERRCARWAVCDNGMKRVAVFEYRDRAAADAKLIQVREAKSGTFFLLLVKDPYDPTAEAAPA